MNPIAICSNGIGPDGILFDLDGTLWDSGEGVAEAWTQVLARYPGAGRSAVTVGEVHGWMGKTMTVIAAEMLPNLPEEDRHDLMQACMDWENAWLAARGGVLFPGLEETLAQLAEKLPLFIVSNCQSGYIEAFLVHHGLDGYFRDFECFGRTGLEKDENILLVASRNGLKNPIYVGDTSGDAEAAEKAGVPFIHAAYGFGTVKEGTPAISDLRQLPGLLGCACDCKNAADADDRLHGK